MHALCNGIVHFLHHIKIIPAQQKVGVLMTFRNLISIKSIGFFIKLAAFHLVFKLSSSPLYLVCNFINTSIVVNEYLYEIRLIIFSRPKYLCVL